MRIILLSAILAALTCALAMSMLWLNLDSGRDALRLQSMRGILVTLVFWSVVALSAWGALLLRGPGLRRPLVALVAGASLLTQVVVVGLGLV